MKLILTLLILLIPLPVIAQSQTTSEPTQESTPKIVDSNLLQVQLVKANQNPESKNIDFVLVIYPQVTTDRLQVSWTGSGVAVPLTPTNNKTIPVTSGVVVTVPVTFSFKTRLITSNPLSVIKFNVQAFLADGTLTSTISQDFFTNLDGSLIPVSSAVATLSTAVTVISAAKLLLGIVVGCLVIYFGYILARRWIYTGKTI